MGMERDRGIDVHRPHPLRALLQGAGDGRERLARLLDELARVIDDAPAPAGVLRGRERGDLHGALPAAPTEPALVGRREGRASDEELQCHDTPPDLTGSPAVEDTTWSATDAARAVVW